MDSTLFYSILFLFLLFFNWVVHLPSCCSVGKGTLDGSAVPQLVIFNFLQPLHVCGFHPAPNTKNKTTQIKNLTTFPKENKEHWKTSRNNEIAIQSDRKANMMVMTELVCNIYKYNNKCTTPEHLPSPSECLAYTWLGVMPTNPTVTRLILGPHKIGIRFSWPIKNKDCDRVDPHDLHILPFGLCLFLQHIY